MNDKELNDAIAAKLHPRVTAEMVDEAIEKVDYLRAGKLTVCVLTLRNGFKVTGESSCVDERNNDQKIGDTISKKNAVDKVWELEGYALAERIRMAAEINRSR